MNKIIFCDIDGTILDGSRGMHLVSEQTRYAIRQLQEQKDRVIIASGRCKGLLSEDITSLDPDGYILCNGAYAEVDGRELYSMYFPKEAISKVRDVVKKHDGFCIFEAVDEMFVDSLSSDPFLAFMKAWGSSFSEFQEEKGESDYLIGMIGFLNRKDMIDAGEELKDCVDLAAHRQFTSYDVNIKGVDKSIGTRRIIAHLGIPLEDTYCFGDAVNDLEMLESVGHPVIVANCSEDLKGLGFEETDDVLEDGFYRYLIRNKLIKAM